MVQKVAVSREFEARLRLDFCQSKMLQIHIKSHLPLWYHYTSFQHLGLFKSGSETDHFPDRLINFKQLQLCCNLNWPLAICGLSRPLTELQWFIVSKLVWAWKPSFMTLHSHYTIAMVRNKRSLYFMNWFCFWNLYKCCRHHWQVNIIKNK